MEYTSIGAYIRKAENDYITGKTIISKYVDFSQFENIEKIDAYANSKHVSGETDSLGRDKPFFNIVTSAMNIWFRATDIDRKDIRIKATSAKQFVGAYIATIHLQEWMRRDAFGQLLNDWGRSLARYGSSVLKFVQKGDGLHSSVVPWNTIICDTVDFDNNPVIEKLYFTPAQLRTNQAYDQKKVEELITALKAREGVDKIRKDNRPDYIELYEFHGLFPKSFLTGKETDDDIYVQQMQVISFFKSGGSSTEYIEFCLLKGKEKQSPYIITHLIKEDGRTQAIGAVEYLFEAQWMSNHTAKQIKDQLDLASKLIFQTNDTNFVGQNILTSIENGDIMIHKDNSPLTQVQNNSHDITSLQNFAGQWQVLAKEITSTPDAISGATLPSNTPYALGNLLNNEAHSLFELMTENKGLAIEEMMRKFILPYLKTKMSTSDEIAATLDAHGVTQLDSMYVKNEAIRQSNRKIKDKLFSNKPTDILSVNPQQQQQDIQDTSTQIQDGLNQLGNQRFLKPSEVSTKTWDDIFKDLQWEVEVEVTNEQSDKNAVLTSLSTVLQTIANPATAQVLQTPQGKILFNKILETTGVLSPIEMSQVQSPMPQQPQPQQPNSSLVGGTNLPVNK